MSKRLKSNAFLVESKKNIKNVGIISDKKDYTLTKQEILSSKAEITTLFANGDCLFSYPFKCFLQENQAHSLLRVLVSVGKKYHKRAVKRNVVRRRAKESFRLHKHLFYEASCPSGIDVVMVYIGKKEESYEVIKNGIAHSVRQIVARFEHKSVSQSDQSML